MEALEDFLAVAMEAQAMEGVPVVGQTLEDPAMVALEDQATAAPVLEALVFPAVAMEVPALEVVPADGQALEDLAMVAVEDQAMVALEAFQLEAMAAQATEAAPEDGLHPVMEVAAEDQAMEAPALVAPATAVLLALVAAQGDGQAPEDPPMEAAAVIEAAEDVDGMDAAAAEDVVTAGLHSRYPVTEEGPVEAPGVTLTPGSLLQSRFIY